ncbi:hypothetical protein ElyMa_004901200 [Elysia marginata]|uniref:Uncharacterized protein n=1 Tax=Elysia marginata TaxID=1093978 RepID=A0AAV4IVM9_9GAST|nr:hypothetical protein ElyMa_004901200 [Elysia marginata]
MYQIPKECPILIGYKSSTYSTMIFPQEKTQSTLKTGLTLRVFRHIFSLLRKSSRSQPAIGVKQTQKNRSIFDLKNLIIVTELSVTAPVVVHVRKSAKPGSGGNSEFAQPCYLSTNWTEFLSGTLVIISFLRMEAGTLEQLQPQET